MDKEPKKIDLFKLPKFVYEALMIVVEGARLLRKCISIVGIQVRGNSINVCGTASAERISTVEFNRDKK
jgi:hypothetical protein